MTSSDPIGSNAVGTSQSRAFDERGHPMISVATAAVPVPSASSFSFSFNEGTIR